MDEPWTCLVCTLQNVAENDKCNLCGKPRGTPDPDDDLDDDTAKHMSLKAILKAGPEAFDREIQEVKRLEALKEVRGVFGVVLNSETPVVVCDCIAYLRAQGMYTVGLFRIPGQQDMVDAIKLRYSQEKDEDVLAQLPCEVHDVATLLKSYFRWLPEPIVPQSSYEMVLDTCRRPHPTRDALEKAVFGAIKKLQSPNRECLCLLIQFLREVARFEQYNKMSPANLATCFAPSLLRAPDDVAPEQALMDMSPAIGVLVTLIRSDRPLFMPPKEQVKKATKHRPKGVVAPPPGMGGDAGDGKKRVSRKKSLSALAGALTGRRRSSKKDKVDAPPGLGKAGAAPPQLPARSRKNSTDEGSGNRVQPPKPAKEVRKQSKVPSVDIDKKI